MGILSSKIENKLLEECQRHVSLIDQTASGLADSVDSVHTTVDLLLKLNLETGYDRSRNQKYVKGLTDLLGSVERILCCQKQALLEALSSFANFLLKSKDPKSDNIRALKNLSIDAYLKVFRQKETSSTIPPAGAAKSYSLIDGSGTGKTLSTTKTEESQEVNPDGLHFKMKECSQNIKRMIIEREAVITKTKDNNAELNNIDENLNVEIERQLSFSEDLCTENNILVNANSTLSKTLDDLKKTIKPLEESLNNKTLDIKKMRAEIDSLEALNSKLQERLIPKTETIQVQLYSSCRGDMLLNVEAELVKLLRDSLENERLKLEFSQCAKQSELEPDIPTLLLCITASRLGTDVAHAIQGLTTFTNSMALVIFHHKDKHALPSQASDRVLTGSELSGIGGIYDFAFLAATGLHKNCQLNNNSIISLVRFIRK